MTGIGTAGTALTLYRCGKVTPQRIPEAGGVVRFRGSGRARFRVQHTGDAGGRPDRLGWVDVSALSDATRGEDLRMPAGSVVGLFADTVTGDLDLPYRRHGASWLRVVPLDHRDKPGIVACRDFIATLEPPP